MRSLSLAMLNTCLLFLLLGSGSVLAKDSSESFLDFIVILSARGLFGSWLTHITPSN
jgi:hypothetical protein